MIAAQFFLFPKQNLAIDVSVITPTTKCTFTNWIFRRHLGIFSCVYGGLVRQTAYARRHGTAGAACVSCLKATEIVGCPTEVTRPAKSSLFEPRCGFRLYIKGYRRRQQRIIRRTTTRQCNARSWVPVWSDTKHGGFDLRKQQQQQHSRQKQHQRYQQHQQQQQKHDNGIKSRCPEWGEK